MEKKFYETSFFASASAWCHSLINQEYIKSHLTHEAPWASGHNAQQDYLGCGMLYYALAYMSKARLCVCLGSGGGFVPRIMRQAQRDLKEALKNCFAASPRWWR